MPCMCGDTACPSCGPAQGYNLEMERVADWLADAILSDLEDVLEKETHQEFFADPIPIITNFLLEKFGACSQEFIDALQKEAGR